MQENIEKLLELITDIVNEDGLRWAEKRELVKKVAAGNEFWKVTFQEFISWFLPDEED